MPPSEHLRRQALDLASSPSSQRLSDPDGPAMIVFALGIQLHRGPNTARERRRLVRIRASIRHGRRGSLKRAIHALKPGSELRCNLEEALFGRFVDDLFNRFFASDPFRGRT